MVEVPSEPDDLIFDDAEDHDDTPRTVRIDWPVSYRFTLPALVDGSSSSLDPILSQVIDYTDKVSRIEEGSLPANYGLHNLKDISRALIQPFTELSESLFSDGSFGVYYTARDWDLAVREAAERLSPILMVARSRYAQIELCAIETQVHGDFHDFCFGENADNLDPEIDLQDFARQLRSEGSQGIVFLSREGPDEESPSVAVFDAQCLTLESTTRRILLEWQDGAFTGYSEKGELQPFT